MTDSTWCWKHSSDISLHIYMTASRSCCRFVGCTSMMWISRSFTSQRCSTEIWTLWRPFEFSELHVMFKKPVWDDLSFVTWCVVLLEASITRWEYSGHKGIDVVSRNTLWRLNDAQLWRTQSVARKYLHTITPHPAWTVDTRQNGSMLSCFYPKFWPNHPNDAAEIETHQSRQPFSNLLLCSFGEPVWIVAWFSCSQLTGVALGVSSAAGAHLL